MKYFKHVTVRYVSLIPTAAVRHHYRRPVISSRSNETGFYSGGVEFESRSSY
jgi:hypothetical protein